MGIVRMDFYVVELLPGSNAWQVTEPSVHGVLVALADQKELICGVFGRQECQLPARLGDELGRGGVNSTVSSSHRTRREVAELLVVTALAEIPQ